MRIRAPPPRRIKEARNESRLGHHPNKVTALTAGKEESRDALDEIEQFVEPIAVMSRQLD